MGIAFCLIRTTPENIELLRGRPKAVAEFVYQDPDVCEARKQSWVSKLFGGSTGNDDRPVPKRSAGDETDLDKAWHIVHYLLCGDTGRGEGPLALIGVDQHPLADLDLGLGKPNVVSADSVAAFANRAFGMTDDDFLARYIPGQMPLGELYLGEVIARGDVDDIREYSLEKFDILRKFVQQAADSGEAIITYYT